MLDRMIPEAILRVCNLILVLNLLIADGGISTVGWAVAGPHLKSGHLPELLG